MIATFRKWLDIPAIRSVLERSAYSDPSHREFPNALKPVWKAGIGPCKVERERRFFIRLEDVNNESRFWNGSLDRVVWLGEADRIFAADILDFKTDDLTPGNEEGLAQRAEHYRPQLDSYRRAVAKLANLSEKCISARLVFPFAGCTIKV